MGMITAMQQAGKLWCYPGQHLGIMKFKASGAQPPALYFYVKAGTLVVASCRLLAGGQVGLGGLQLALQARQLVDDGPLPLSLRQQL